MPKPWLSSGERSQKSWSGWQEPVFLDKLLLLSALHGGTAPTTPETEDEEGELSTATTYTKYRVPRGMNRKGTYEEEEKNRTHEKSCSMVENTSSLSEPTHCHVNVTQREIFDRPLPFTKNQATQELGMPRLAQTAACHNLFLARQVSHFIKNLEIYNYTGPLGPQLCKRIHNKPTEQASPTCLSQRAKLLERGNTEPFQGGSECGRQECNIQSLQKKQKKNRKVTNHNCSWFQRKMGAINLKRLNSFVQTEHFKMEGIHMLKDLLKPGD